MRGYQLVHVLDLAADPLAGRVLWRDPNARAVTTPGPLEGVHFGWFRDLWWCRRVGILEVSLDGGRCETVTFGQE
jgi:hypothetical protein